MGWYFNLYHPDCQKLKGLDETQISKPKAIFSGHGQNLYASHLNIAFISHKNFKFLLIFTLERFNFLMHIHKYFSLELHWVRYFRSILDSRNTAIVSEIL